MTWTCPHSSRTVIVASISANCPHSCTSVLHCPVHITVVALTCSELPALPCPITCSGPDLHLLVVPLCLSCSAMPCSPFCPCPFLLYLAPYVMPRVTNTGRGSESGETVTSSSFIVYYLSHLLSIISVVKPHKLLDSSQKTFFRFSEATESQDWSSKKM